MKLVLILLLVPQLAFSLDRIRETVKNNSIESITQEQKETVEHLEKRHLTKYQRPESCPLSSDKYMDILSKLEGIKLLFENTCFSDYQDQFDAILAGATNLQTAVNTQIENSETENPPPTIETPQINGQDVTTVISGLNNLFTKNTCSIDNRSFFEKASEIVRDVTSFGSLVPGNNGLMIQGGGAATSALLLFLNELFKKSFNFKDRKYREIFIKLNCSFYDVRKEIELSGFMDIPTDEHQQNSARAKELITSIEKRLEANKNGFEKITNVIEEEFQKELATNHSLIVELNKTLLNAKDITHRKLTAGELPLETQKLNFIYDLGHLAQTLISQYREFSPQGDLLDEFFLEDLHKFVPGNDLRGELVSMDIETFKSELQARLIFNIDRAINTLENRKNTIKENWMSNTRVGDRNISNLSNYLNEQISNVQKELEAFKKTISQVDQKLDRILGNRDFTSRDEGAENIVNILDEFNIVLHKIYGKIGYQFMDFSLSTSDKELRRFESKYRKFSRNHLGANDTIKDPNSISQWERIRACQDAKPFRRMYKYGSSLSEQAYDFIETNAELFYGDTFSLYLRRSEDLRHPFFMTKWEKLRRHHQSAYYANRYINGLEDNENHHILSRKSLGELMIKSFKNKSRAKKLQEVIELYECKNISNDVE